MTIDVIHTGPLGVNTYIVPLGGSAVFIVDPASCAFSSDEFAVTRFLEEKKYTPVAIILTHGHFDHVAGLPHLVSCYPQIEIAIHKNDAPFIGKNSIVLQSESLSSMGFDAFIPSVSNLPEPTQLLSEGRSFYNWRILSTPGHSSGSICLYNEKERTLISGDTLFYHAYGRTDLPGGNEMSIQKSLRRLRKEIPENTLVYPGHDAYGFVMADGGVDF